MYPLFLRYVVFNYFTDLRKSEQDFQLQTSIPILASIDLPRSHVSFLKNQQRNNQPTLLHQPSQHSINHLDSIAVSVQRIQATHNN